VRSASGWALIAGSIVAVLVGLGLVIYGVLAWSGQVGAVHDTTGEDQSGTFILWGALLFVFGLFLARRFRRWVVARRVERLSSDPADRRASVVRPRRG
jgi:LPXTG-motif cell wall-anchored protein